MSKAQRDAEIDRILDLAVAEENTRLMQGGIGPGDDIADHPTIEHDGNTYLDLRPTKGREPEPVPAPARDEYRELIEVPARTVPERVQQLRARVLKGEALPPPEAGYLLEVIDAYVDGRL